jgi:hypothetical protein
VSKLRLGFGDLGLSIIIIISSEALSRLSETPWCLDSALRNWALRQNLDSGHPCPAVEAVDIDKFDIKRDSGKRRFCMSYKAVGKGAPGAVCVLDGGPIAMARSYIVCQ